ncbi:enoyl-CoA hydratase/isomerase family protein [Phycicoccus sp. 3266]|uniref:enoyl-CoA hydratase/isomerase family protein n=1 Tax=Phycicoccus sp. 3266 TaxID=2817751 RepID=UPI002865B183|nr:enoyl-CoA hydratase/isomerase family protein [Phycicoccus sp. 3266]MDR6864085.1 enoyl-CoA hydratase/carnithine racemase [Phycicoccus sp. 3266]
MSALTWWETPFEDLSVALREASGRRVAVVTLDLPERRNSMSEAMTRSWVRLMGRLGEDEDLAAVVVTGAPPAFCAGGDLSWIVAEPDASVPRLRERMLAFYRSWLSVRDLPVPTIAAVNGAAIGAGFALALACDIRYAAQDARLGVPFTSLGLHPGMATTWSLPDVAGMAVARDLLLTGRVVTGAEAVGLGLVSGALAAEAVLDEALAAADRVAAAAPVATRLTLQALRGGGHDTVETALQWEALAQATTLSTEDVHEGIAAAAARRRPEFRGR